MNKEQLTDLFGTQFKQMITSNKTVEFDSIDPDLIEMYGAAVVYFLNKDLIWICRENIDVQERKKKLENWFSFFNLKNVDVVVNYLPFEDPYINNEIEKQRLGEKVRLVESLFSGQKRIVLTTLSALNLKFESTPTLKDSFKTIRVGEEIARDQFIRLGLDFGYRVKDFIKSEGDLSYRGSIVDVFPVGSQFPCRIEIEADFIESIRRFDLDSQSSVTRLNSFHLFKTGYFNEFSDIPDYITKEKSSEGLIDLFTLLGDYEILINNKIELEEEAKYLKQMFEDFLIIKQEEQDDVKTILPFPLNFDLSSLNKRYIAFNTNIYSNDDDLSKIRSLKSGINYTSESNFSFLKQKYDSENKFFFFSRNQTWQNNLKEHFPDSLFFDYLLPCSFENRNHRVLYLSDKISPDKKMISDLFEVETDEMMDAHLGNISDGDLIVHQKHGIGRFRGIKKLNLAKESSDFFKIEFKGMENLYVPVYEINVLSVYSSFSADLPNLDKLGGKTWSLKKRRAKKNILLFAENLLNLYSKRKSSKGRSYIPQPDLEELCIKEFKFVETRDQRQAIKSVMKDLSEDFPMDRLVCGDVGFGKTEVAIRAALRVVTNGMQVAILAPTTILAFQHYQTFTQRFANLPVKVAMISRMVKKKEREGVLRDLAGAKVDILIGTHALLSDKVSFSNLGLYILDEEQRFGVFQKEKLKENCEDVDVLTLTATPIPRTLSLLMADMSDISVIRTPPMGRIAIKNYIGYLKRSVIVSAVSRELSRSGQVFIVYNNIEKIYDFANKVKQWLPEITIGIIHAKMTSQSIEKSLFDFINKKFSVLLSTTIIENGIDISNVNTLIVVGAQNFGLTQLYQLRGRIGRSTRQAYAFFMLTKKNITNKATLRMEGIKEFADLGAGYEIAKYDYSLRGAGSLLGNKQHGHIEALGFEYYNEMLKKSVKELKGGFVSEREPTIHVNFSTRLDDLPFLNPGVRINLYKKILEGREFSEIHDLKLELIDRYGVLSDEISKILYIGIVRLIARKIKAVRAEILIDSIKFEIDQESDLTNESLKELDLRIAENLVIIDFEDLNVFNQKFI